MDTLNFIVGVSHTSMKSVFATAAILLLAACSNSFEPLYGIAGARGAATQGQAERQLLERTLQLQTKDKKFDAPIKLLHAPLPGYPEHLRAANIYGTVRITFLVEKDGTVSNPQILGSPPAPLAAISVNALLTWRFAPIFIEGKPAQIQLTQPFTFQLGG
jgi:TonB family protein